MIQCTNNNPICSNIATTRNYIGQACCESCRIKSDKAMRDYNELMHRTNREEYKIHLDEDMSDIPLRQEK